MLGPAHRPSVFNQRPHAAARQSNRRECSNVALKSVEGGATINVAALKIPRVFALQHVHSDHLSQVFAPAEPFCSEKARGGNACSVKLLQEDERHFRRPSGLHREG